MYNITLCRLAVLKRWSRYEEHIRRYPVSVARRRPRCPDLPIRNRVSQKYTFVEVARCGGHRPALHHEGSSRRRLMVQPRTLSVRVGSCNWRFGKSVTGVAQHYGREGRPPVVITWGARPAKSMGRAPSPSRFPSPCEQVLLWTCPLYISDSIRTRAPEKKNIFTI